MHNICCRCRRHFCGAKNFMWSNCVTWQAILHHMTICFCNVEQFFMWSFGKLLHICNVELFAITPQEKFTMYAVLSWFTLFWRKTNFLFRFKHFCVKQKLTNKSCQGMYSPKLTQLSPKPNCFWFGSVTQFLALKELL